MGFSAPLWIALSASHDVPFMTVSSAGWAGSASPDARKVLILLKLFPSRQSTIGGPPTTRASSCALQPSAGVPACPVECLLDVPHTLLDLALDLPRHALHLLIRTAGRLANLLLYLARDILEASFDLVLVHSNLRMTRLDPAPGIGQHIMTRVGR